MPSISGTNAASTYSEDKKHPNLTGKGRSSTTPSSSSTPSALDKASQNSSRGQSGKQPGANNMDRGTAGAETSGAAPSKHSANNQGSDNMGGGSSAIFSQGPKQESSEQDRDPPSKGEDPQGDASTPAMPSMSGTGAATSYSDSAKNKSLTGRSSSSGGGGGGGSSKSGITRNPTASNTASDNMGGGSSAIYSQGPRQGGRQEGSEGDASTPAMPSMSGSNAASMYADRTEKRTLSGRTTSANSASTRTDSSSNRRAAGDDASGSATDHFSGQISD